MKGLGLDPRKEPDFFKAMLGSQRFRKHITQRLICFGVLFIVWLYINGGMISVPVVNGHQLSRIRSFWSYSCSVRSFQPRSFQSDFQDESFRPSCGSFRLYILSELFRFDLFNLGKQ